MGEAEVTAAMAAAAALALPAARVRPRCMAIGVGSRVKVAKPVTCYQMPGFKDGKQMEGMEGVVEKVVDANLSATQKIRVKFEFEADGKRKKASAHFAEGELEEV